MTSGITAEKHFRIIFMLAIIVFCIFIIILALLIIKILLLFFPEINLMGLTFADTL